MKKCLILIFTYCISLSLNAQNYLKISSYGRDGYEIDNIIAIDTSSIKTLITDKYGISIYYGRQYYQLDSLNYFALIEFLKTKNLLYPDIRRYQTGNVFQIIDKENKETLYQVIGLGKRAYNKVRNKIARLSKIKRILKLLDSYFYG
jgi:hypothetical protein